MTSVTLEAVLRGAAFALCMAIVMAIVYCVGRRAGRDETVEAVRAEFERDQLEARRKTGVD